MHVTVSRTFPQVLRPDIDSLVRTGFDGVECSYVEVLVKARARVRRVYDTLFDDGSGYRFDRKRDALAVAAIPR